MRTTGSTTQMPSWRCEMAQDANYPVEDEEDSADFDTPHGRLITSLGAAKSAGLVPLAFTVTDDRQPVAIDGLAISWTREAIAAFSGIRAEARVRDPSFEANLPYASLRTLVELTLHNVSRIERG